MLSTHCDRHKTCRQIVLGSQLLDAVDPRDGIFPRKSFDLGGSLCSKISTWHLGHTLKFAVRLLDLKYVAVLPKASVHG